MRSTCDEVLIYAKFEHVMPYLREIDNWKKLTIDNLFSNKVNASVVRQYEGKGWLKAMDNNDDEQIVDSTW